MNRIFLVLATLFSTSSAMSQKLLSKIEIRPYLRKDWYPGFSYNYMGRASTDYLKMEGMSWGIDFNYKLAVKRKLNYKIGLGYLRYRFNKLRNFNSNFGASDSRIINYPSQIDPIFVTNKYLYNVIPFSIGVQKFFTLRNKLKISSGAEVNNFFTISQSYNIKHRGITYKVHDKSLFGNSFQISCGILKQHKKSNIAPILSIPIYTVWQKDDVFAENENEKRSKWFNGFSIGIQIQFFTKN